MKDNEKEELTEYDSKHNRRPYIDVIRDRLVLTNCRLTINPTGLSYEEFRALIKLGDLTRTSILPSRTLELLRDRILLLLDQEIDKQIRKWLMLKKQLEEVADSKHFMLKLKEY